MFWGAIIGQSMKIFKNEYISVGALVLLACGLFWVHAWADDKFAKVEDLITLQQTVEIGFESIAIENASQEIRDIKLSKQMALAINSPAAIVEGIDDELVHVVRYKQCLIERGTNCEHLRQVE